MAHQLKILLLSSAMLLFGCTAGITLFPCDFYGGEDGWTYAERCVQEIPNTFGRIDPSLVPKLPYEQDTSLAPIRLSDGFAYVNREGAIIIRGVLFMDNGADPFMNGLTRFRRNGKIGFANMKGEVVIPPRYDGALPFENGYARVCVGCTEQLMDEYHYYAGGEWSCLDTVGKTMEWKRCGP